MSEQFSGNITKIQYVHPTTTFETAMKWVAALTISLWVVSLAVVSADGLNLDTATMVSVAVAAVGAALAAYTRMIKLEQRMDDMYTQIQNINSNLEYHFNHR
jgi:hypothetical protein